MNKTKKQQHIDLDSEESAESKHKLDLSVLRKPIITSITGFEEVLKAYADGTEELKRLMSKECDIIYECKVCRNIFRSLANFISHKRVYCRGHFNSSDHFYFNNNGYVEQDISTIIQAEQEIHNNPYTSNIVNGSDDKSKDLSSIVERLLRKQHKDRPKNFSEVCEATKDESSQSSSKKNQTLKLDRLSNVAVYQTLQHDNESSNMKTEVNEVHKMLLNNNTVLGPDGKILTLFSDTVSTSRDSETSHKAVLSDNEESFHCEICNLKFETEKTMKLHNEIKHQPSTYVHQCPMCPLTFSQPAAVYRHLSNDHKKSNRKIRMMRDKIIKKRIRADEVVVKNQNRELTNLELNADDNMVWIEKDWTGEYDSDARMMCVYCGKKFDRKAVHTTHMVSCAVKNKVLKQKKSTNLEACKSKKILGIIESEENSNMSEGSQHRDGEQQKLDMEQIALHLEKLEEQHKINEDSNSSSNRRKRKRTNRIKPDVSPAKLAKSENLSRDEEDVDWNLDDEEEKLKIDNIKKEIIAHDYGQTSHKKNDEILVATQDTADFHGFSLNEFNDDDKDNDDLVIDEKLEDSGVNTTMNSSAPTEDSVVAVDESLKCIICDKVFKDTSKRNDHVINYHQRQKRFKCSLCDYHGYRIKDTLNHLNTVHQLVGTKDTLGTYMETVMRNIDAEEIMKLSLIKKEKYKLMKQKKLEKMENNQKIKQEPVEEIPSLVPVSVKTENAKQVEKDGMLKDILKKEQKEIPLPNLPSLVPISTAKHSKVTPSPSALSEVLPSESFSTKAVSILKSSVAKSSNINSTKLKPDLPKPSLTAIKTESPLVASSSPQLSSSISRSNPTSTSTPKIAENDDESQSDSVNQSSQKNTDQEMSDEQSSKKDPEKIKKRARRLKRKLSEDADTFVKISNFGKIARSVPQSPKEIQSRRPIRNRIKPVNKDFVYDLSGLLKKESDVFKESAVVPVPPIPSRRESTRRKCTLQPFSTGFNGAIDSKILSDEEFFEQDHDIDDNYIDTAASAKQTKTTTTETKQNFCKTLTEPVATVEKKDKPATAEKIFSDEEDIPLINFRESSQESPKIYGMSSKRMVEKRHKVSVESEMAKEITIDGFGNKNSISYKMSVKAVNDNRAALYEPQYFHTISFKSTVPANVSKLIAPKYSVVPANVSNSSTKKVSAAASILEKFTSRKLKTMEEKTTFSPEQLCKKFEKINVNSIESEMGDESLSTTFPIKMEDGKNEFIAFSCETEGDNIILKALSDSESDNATPNSNETASPNSKTVSNSAPSHYHHHHLPGTSASHSSTKKHGSHKKGHLNSRRQKKLKFRQNGTSSANSSMPSSRSCSKKSLDKRKHSMGSGSSSSSNKRLTVIQRVLENQVKKSREQLFKKLTTRKPMIQQRVFNIFNEV